MTGSSPSALITVEELLALPEAGMERELIRGHLKEKLWAPKDPRHGRTQAGLVYLLGKWLDRQTEPRGEILSGGQEFLLRRDPDTTVGIDVVYITPEVADAAPDDAILIEAPPLLAVEILSPSDTQEEILDTVEECLEAGVALVWIVEPVFRTVTVYRRDREPELFNAHQELSGEPYLPGLRIPVAMIFSR